MYRKFYTTQMCRESKSIEKRFKMITDKRKIKWYVSAVSIIAAAVMTITGVFASGLFAGENIGYSENDKVYFYYGDEYLDLENKPFIRYNEVYLPLREILEKTQTNYDMSVSWHDGTIFIMIDYKLKSDYKSYYDSEIYVGSSKIHFVSNINYFMKNPVILENGVTYVPYEFFMNYHSNVVMHRDNDVTGFSVIVSDNDNVDDEKLKILKKARIWAMSLKTRDGRPRYDMMNNDMKAEFVEKQTAEDGNLYFRIGGSSPRIDCYDIEIIDNAAYIVYQTTDSSGEEFDQREIVTFEKDTLLVSDCYEMCEEYERAYWYTNSPENMAEGFINALLNSDYMEMLSCIHSLPFDDNGDMIWKSIKIGDAAITGRIIGEDTAVYEIEINVLDNGVSELKKGVHKCRIIMTKGEGEIGLFDETGWFIESCNVDGEPFSSVMDY